MQRRGVKIVLLALVAALLTAPIVAAQDLTVWTGRLSAVSSLRRSSTGIKKRVRAFNIELQEISGGQDVFTEKITLAIASGALPDLTWLEGSTVIELAAQGLSRT